MRKRRLGKDVKREVTPEFVNMSKEILYPQIQGVTLLRANGRLQIAVNAIQCAEVRAEPEGTPDSLQDLSGAPPDCPVAQKAEAPTVEP